MRVCSAGGLFVAATRTPWRISMQHAIEKRPSTFRNEPLPFNLNRYKNINAQIGPSFHYDLASANGHQFRKEKLMVIHIRVLVIERNLRVPRYASGRLPSTLQGFHRQVNAQYEVDHQVRTLARANPDRRTFNFSAQITVLSALIVLAL